MGKIEDGAIALITKSWEQTYAAWGEQGIERINALMQPAAELVAASPGCDKLVNLALSGVLSSPPDKIVFFAESANGEKFNITEDDIINKRKVVSLNEKSKWLDDQQLIEISQEAVKAKLESACTFFGQSVYRAMAGRTVVDVGFVATTGSGQSVTSFAKCYFDGISLKEIEIGPQ